MAKPHLNFSKFLGPAKTYWKNLKSGELITVGVTALGALSLLASMGITVPYLSGVQAALPKLPAFGTGGFDKAIF